jgi:hypothetical protein
MLVKWHEFSPFLKERSTGGKPFEPFGKGSKLLRRREHGTTGDVPCRINPIQAMNCWGRPFSSRPKLRGSPPYTDFTAVGKHAGGPGTPAVA